MRLPNNTQRHAIYGQTGSGKTVAGLWALEKRDFLRRPWVLLDFKRDKTIRRIPRLEEIDVRHRPPSKKQPGLYVIRPRPDEQPEVDALLWKLWEQENIGLFVDESYMIPRLSKPWTAVLTQGRSKNIPLIGLSQRPSWLSPFFMSEADFHQVLHVQKPEDVKALREWLPGLQQTKRDFHSQYYDVASGDMTYLKPVPDEEEILDRFDLKMPHRVKLFTGLFVNAPNSRGKKYRAA